MFYHHHRRAVLNQPVKHFQKHAHVLRVQSYRRFVEYENRVVLRPLQLRRQFQPLRFPARKRGRAFAERQISEPQFRQRFRFFADFLMLFKQPHGFSRGNVHQLRNRIRSAAQFRFRFVRPLCVSPASAIGADDFHVRQKLNIHRNFAGLATQASRIVRKIVNFPAVRFRFRRAGEKLS